MAAQVPDEPLQKKDLRTRFIATLQLCTPTMGAVTDRAALKKKLREVFDSQEAAVDEAAPKNGSAAHTSGQSPDDDNSAQSHSQTFVNVYGENARSPYS